MILQSQDPSDTVSHSEGHFGQCIKTEGPLHAGLTNELKGWSAARPMKIPFLLLALSSHSAPVPGTLSRNSSHLPRDIPDLLSSHLPRDIPELLLPGPGGFPSSASLPAHNFSRATSALSSEKDDGFQEQGAGDAAGFSFKCCC